MFRGRNGEIKPLSLALKPKKIMQRFGSGIYLYFRVLRLLTYLLLSMTIVAIPWVVVINLGTPIDEFGTEIEFSRPKGVLGIDRLILRTTFGWLWQDWSRTPRQNWDGMRVRIPFSDHIIRRDTLQYVIAGLDLVGILWLLAAVRALYKWASEKAAEQEDRDTVTITDYAVLVRGESLLTRAMAKLPLVTPRGSAIPVGHGT